MINVTELYWTLAVVIVIVIIMLIFRKKITKEEKESIKGRIENYKKIPTNGLRDILKQQEEIREFAGDEFERRKDIKPNERARRLFKDIISSGMIILICGIIFSGAIAPMFHVNDEFTNPTKNMSRSVNQSMTLIANAGTTVITSLQNNGRSHPWLWFVTFFAVVFMFWILPILKYIYQTIKYDILKKT